MGIVFIMKSDYIDKVVECCIEREKVLFNKQPISKYNRLYDKMNMYVKKVIEENNQEKLLKYLESENISVRFDIATMLYEFYPEKCINVLTEISNMDSSKGLQKHLFIIAVAAGNNLKYGLKKIK